MVDDKELNSFVAGGQAVFINTGLIERADQSMYAVKRTRKGHR